MRVRAIAVVFALLAVAGSATRARAQTDPGDWRTVAGGDEVVALLLDPRDPDRLLAGTEGGGLVIWDLRDGSYEQQLYPSQPALRSNTVTDLAISADGDLWLATANGVTTASGPEWRSYGTADGLPSHSITAIALQSDGTVWAGTPEQGLAVLDPGASVWRVLTAEPSQPTASPGADSVADILVYDDGTDRVWVAHGRGSGSNQPALSMYDPATGRWEHTYADSDPSRGPAGDQIMALALDADGVLWMASWAKGVLSYNGRTWGQYGEPDGVCGRNVLAIAAGEAGVWAACGDGTVGEGASRYTNGTWETFSGDDLPTDDVATVAVADRLAYLGTNGPGDSGLGIVPFDLRAGEPLSTAPAAPYSNDVTAIAFDDLGSAWVGTRGAGLMRYDGAQWTQYTQESTGGLLVGDTIADLLVRDGDLWVAVTKTTPSGTGWADGGVSILDIATGRWSDPLPRSSAGGCDGLPDLETSSLAVDGSTNERVWVGTGIASGGLGYDRASHQGNGIVVYDPVDDTWECFAYDNTGDGAGLAGDTVLDVAFAQGAAWVAASYFTSGADQRKYGGGASEYAAGRWTAWGDDDEGLKTYSPPAGRDPITGDMRSVGVDDAGAVWMGSWDLDQGDLTNVWPFVDAVVNERVGSAWVPHVFPGSGWVSAIATDSISQVWVGTTRGHESTRHETEHSAAGRNLPDTAEGGIRVWDGSGWTRLLSPDGAPSTEPASGLAAKGVTSLALDPSTGAMWVGTENGGISIYDQGGAAATRTPAPGVATATPRPTDGATRPAVLTIPPPTPCAGCPTATSVPRPTDLPEPKPPPEVPEASTLALVGAGLAGLAVWMRRRRG